MEVMSISEMDSEPGRFEKSSIMGASVWSRTAVVGRTYFG